MLNISQAILLKRLWESWEISYLLRQLGWEKVLQIGDINLECKKWTDFSRWGMTFQVNEERDAKVEKYEVV